MAYQGGYTPYDVEVATGEEDYPQFQDDLPVKTSVMPSDGPKLRTSAGVVDDDLLNPLVKIRDFTPLLQIHVGVAAAVCSTIFMSKSKKVLWSLSSQFL